MSERTAPIVAPYGSWRSPISAELVATSEVSLDEVQLDGTDILWIEGRSAEHGRQVVVRHGSDGRTTDATPPGVNVRSRVHEYGGGAYLAADRTVWYSDFADGRIYEVVVAPAGAARCITPAVSWRYADLVLDRQRRRLICIREDHTEAALAANGEAVNTLVAVPLDGGGKVRVLVQGSDFYATPRISPDGRHLAWLTWRHPNLPWDGTELWLGEFDPDGAIVAARQVAGGPTESVSQPRWSPTGALHFASDRSGWWNLERIVDLGTDGERQPIAPIESDFARPDWLLGLSTYGFTADGTIFASARSNGRDRLLRIDGRTLAVRPIDVPAIKIDYLQVFGELAVFVAGSPTEPSAIVAFDTDSESLETLRRARKDLLDPALISVAEPISFPTSGGRTAHALYYAPRNPDFAPLEGALPPLVVHAHGGPTSAASAALDTTIQFITSRGLAYLDVDYGGSTGYGRSYREQLDGQWGIIDVDDCISGARALVERGLADPERLAIRGGSAGGYTTLAAVTFRDVFAVGVSYFGIGDLKTFVDDTHKFESRYMDRLIGPLPEQANRYHDRSPVHFTDRISCPVLILQGLDDRIVRPGQAEQMVAELRAVGLPYAYLAFEGEDHGFRQAKNIQRSLEAELSLYGQIFGFRPADDLEPIQVENLSTAPPTSRSAGASPATLGPVASRTARSARGGR